MKTSSAAKQGGDVKSNGKLIARTNKYFIGNIRYRHPGHDAIVSRGIRRTRGHVHVIQMENLEVYQGKCIPNGGQCFVAVPFAWASTDGYNFHFVPFFFLVAWLSQEVCMGAMGVFWSFKY